MPTNRIDQLFEQFMSIQTKALHPREACKSFARFVLEKHLTDEINFLDHLIPNVNDPAIEARIENLKQELKR